MSATTRLTRNDDTNIPPEKPGPAGPMPELRLPGPRRCDRDKPEPIRFGDRILVLKYLYLFEAPRPWDVVVFKSPIRIASRSEGSGIFAKLHQAFDRHAQSQRSHCWMETFISADYNAEKPEDFHISRKSNSAQDVLWRVIYDNDFVPQGLDRVDRTLAAAVAVGSRRRQGMGLGNG